ncbi:glycosyltransferase [Candidatus Saccharibacteria bacterium]|nr:glycosyltransferase [Candidatus Saccharibacteria bacterium]
MKRPLADLKVALVCDWLTEVGGAEKVLSAVHDMFPQAPIFTSQYRSKSAPTEFVGVDIRTGWLNIKPRALRKFISPLRYSYFQHLDLSGYDLVISINNAEAKNVKTYNPKNGARAFHISYLQGPPTQYYWGLYDQYLKNPGFGKLNFLARWGLKTLVRPLRKIDYKAAQKPDFLLANSSYVKKEIHEYYQRDARVLWPSVDVKKIGNLVKKVSNEDTKNLQQELFDGQEFFIISGRQNNWKRVDLAVQACMDSNENLLVAGYGADHDKLVAMAKGHDNIKFLPRYDGVGEIVKYFAAAKAFIFPSLEPFGISPVEALAAGTPLIALKKGGALDMVQGGRNGVFFSQQTTDDLKSAIQKINKMKFDRRLVQKSTEKFSEENFKKNLLKTIEDSYEKAKQGSHE